MRLAGQHRRQRQMRHDRRQCAGARGDLPTVRKERHAMAVGADPDRGEAPRRHRLCGTDRHATAAHQKVAVVEREYPAVRAGTERGNDDLAPGGNVDLQPAPDRPAIAGSGALRVAGQIDVAADAAGKRRQIIRPALVDLGGSGQRRRVRQA